MRVCLKVCVSVRVCMSACVRVRVRVCVPACRRAGAPACWRAGVLACFRRAARVRARMRRRAHARARACARARRRVRARARARVRARACARTCACACARACACVRVRALQCVCVCVCGLARARFFSGQTPARQNSMECRTLGWRRGREEAQREAPTHTALVRPEPATRSEVPKSICCATACWRYFPKSPALDTAPWIPRSAGRPRSPLAAEPEWRRAACLPLQTENTSVHLSLRGP